MWIHSCSLSFSLFFLSFACPRSFLSLLIRFTPNFLYFLRSTDCEGCRCVCSECGRFCGRQFGRRVLRSIAAVFKPAHTASGPTGCSVNRSWYTHTNKQNRRAFASLSQLQNLVQTFERRRKKKISDARAVLGRKRRYLPSDFQCISVSLLADYDRFVIVPHGPSQNPHPPLASHVGK